MCSSDLLIFGGAILLPMALTVGYSLTEWNGFGPMTFVGLDNYARAIADPDFLGSFANVLAYIAMTLLLEVLVGLALAGLVDLRPRSLWFRAALFTPVMLPMVVVAVLWSFVYNPDFGLINGALGALGLTGLQRIWLGDPATALPAISVVSGWVWAGFYMTIFHAAFRQVPAEVLGKLAGVEWQGVAYKAIGNAWTDLYAGAIDFMFVDMTAGRGQVVAGKARPLDRKSTRLNSSHT